MKFGNIIIIIIRFELVGYAALSESLIYYISVMPAKIYVKV